MKIPLPVLFGLGTALCWGLYGPTLGNARSPEKLWSPFKPYVGIGLAYILWAFIGGLIVMRFMGDDYNFRGQESAAGIWGFLAGTLGALGALSLTSAMISFEGPPRPQLVMPIVFGGAVTVTAIVSALQQGRAAWNLNLVAGIVIVAAGIVVVAANTPHGHPPKPQTAAATSAEDSHSADATPSNATK